METIKVLGFGAKVVCTSVDMFGYHGRDLHPEETDVGFLGIVIGNHVSQFDDEGGLVGCRENVLGGLEYVYMLGDEIPKGSEPVDICYTVMDPSGRKLELMHHEIERV